jgi:hypothetical protein
MANSSAPELLMDEQARSLDKTAIACGLLAIALGVFILLSAFGIIPSRGGTDGGHWIGVSAGLAFVFGGLAVVIQSCAKATPSGELPSSTPIWVRLTLRLLSLAIVVALGAIGTWVAFGPGERKFGISIPFLPAWLNEPIGRTAFGIGAILIWLFLIVMAVVGARSLRGPKGRV